MPNDPCPRCGRELVEITLDAADRAMTLRSCSHCDVREWSTAEEPLRLEGVLDDLGRRA
jgi:transcription elongation factor Elf1